MQDGDARAVPSLERITFYHAGSVAGPDDPKFRVPSNLDDWSRDCVLIIIVKFTEIVEFVTAPFREGFLRAEGFFLPLTRCHYSIARSFEVNPAIACNKLDVAILRTIADEGEFPRDVVEGVPQIMNSICYYKGNAVREFMDKMNPGRLPPVVRVGMNFNSVWFAGDVGFRLPCKISDVIIGPVDFLFLALSNMTKTPTRDAVCGRC